MHPLNGVTTAKRQLMSKRGFKNIESLDSLPPGENFLSNYQLLFLTNIALLISRYSITRYFLYSVQCI